MSKPVTPNLLVKGGMEGDSYWAQSNTFGLASSSCLSSRFSGASPINPTKCLLWAGKTNLVAIVN